MTIKKPDTFDTDDARQRGGFGGRDKTLPRKLKELASKLYQESGYQAQTVEGAWQAQMEIRERLAAIEATKGQPHFPGARTREEESDYHLGRPRSNANYGQEGDLGLKHEENLQRAKENKG